MVVYKITYSNNTNKIVIGEHKLIEAILNAKYNFTVKELNTYKENY